MQLVSNKTPSSQPFVPVSKRKPLPKNTRDDELSARSGDDSSLSTLVIDGYLQNCDVSGGNGSTNRKTI